MRRIDVAERAEELREAGGRTACVIVPDIRRPCDARPRITTPGTLPAPMTERPT
jgi:hypothetical protein